MSDEYSTKNKALIINQDPLRYGSFAEIGAGQEVARHFFTAGLASKTIAKTMSAYDMQFSDSIYGREPDGRYVCESRLMKMLDQEYGLLVERLGESRGSKTAFFAYANTVTTSTASNRSHGFMGVKFQVSPNSEPASVILHVWMRDRYRLDQQEAIGLLGVNLIFGALFFHDDPKLIISTLTEGLKKERIEIDLIRFEGAPFHNTDNRLMSLELVRGGLTRLVMFNGEGKVEQPSDALYQKSVFIQRGTFRPITNINMQLMQEGSKEFTKSLSEKKNSAETVTLCELTMSQLEVDGQIDEKDFMNRIDLLNHMNFPVLVSNYHFFYELKEHLRRLTKEPIGMVMGASLLEKIFHPESYTNTPGGMVSAMGRLLEDDTTLYIYPFRAGAECISAETLKLTQDWKSFLKFWMDRKRIVDLSHCDLTQTSILSETVRDFVANNDSRWKTMVPEQVISLIEEKKLFRKS